MSVASSRDDRLHFEEDPRYAQANREAQWAIGYWVAFTVVVTGLAWWLGYEKPADELELHPGLPRLVLLVGAGHERGLLGNPGLIIRRYFKDVPLTRDGQPAPGPDGGQ